MRLTSHSIVLSKGSSDYYYDYTFLKWFKNDLKQAQYVPPCHAFAIAAIQIYSVFSFYVIWPRRTKRQKHDKDVCEQL